MGGGVVWEVMWYDVGGGVVRYGRWCSMLRCWEVVWCGVAHVRVTTMPKAKAIPKVTAKVIPKVKVTNKGRFMAKVKVTPKVNVKAQENLT